MASILTHTIIKNAEAAVDTYVKTAQGLKADLDTIISGLCGTNFAGDASDGYKVFYTSTVVPAVEENLTGTQSITQNIKSILEGIEETLLDTVDPQLGENNQNPGTQN